MAALLKIIHLFFIRLFGLVVTLAFFFKECPISVINKCINFTN